MRTNEVAYWNVQMMKRWRKSPAALEARDLEAYWDGRASALDPKVPDPSSLNYAAALIGCILERARLQGSGTCLDLGCGTGALTRAIADRLDAAVGGLSLGIDAAAAMIGIARKKRESATCRFEVAAAENLPCGSSSFDAVVSSLFFHHVDRGLKQQALREAFRVLRPGGRLIVADMHTPTTLFGRLISHSARWLLVQPEIGENIAGMLPLLMAEAGFSPPRLEVMYFGYIALFTTKKPGEPTHECF